MIFAAVMIGLGTFMAQMADKMSGNPAGILRLTDQGTLRAGAEADVVIIDPKETWTIDSSRFKSKGKNTPFDGRQVKGRVNMTVCRGRIVYEDGVKQ